MTYNEIAQEICDKLKELDRNAGCTVSETVLELVVGKYIGDTSAYISITANDRLLSSFRKSKC